MSAVLRKKIEAGAGVPPSILQLQQFWSQVRTRTREWARETYGMDAETVLGVRRVVNGKGAQQVLDQQFAFYFSGKASPGLLAIAIDNAGAVRNAAARMQQETDSVADASPLFLRLLAEQAVLTLWRTVAKTVLDTPVGGASPLVEPAMAGGNNDPAGRYLLVEYQVQLDGTSSRVWYVFHLDFMLDHARDHHRRVEAQKAEARNQSQKSLSDSVLASAVPLDAVLDRLTLTIGECSRLKVGTILPLPDADVTKLRLMADTVNGRVEIGSGELGVWKRQRAVKLHMPVSDQFAQQVADL